MFHFFSIVINIFKNTTFKDQWYSKLAKKVRTANNTKRITDDIALTSMSECVFSIEIAGRNEKD